MYARIRRQFSPTALTLSVIAIVFALAGGAFAAGGLSKPQEKQVKKLAAKEAKKYANSNPGAPGTNGTNGKDGTNGAPGEKGPKGDTGGKGADGTSVVSSTEAPGAHCEKGGSKFVAGASTTYACNGKDGQTGFTKTLPVGETETGTWDFAFEESEAQLTAEVGIPFAIPTAHAGKAFYFTNGQVGGELFGREGGTTPCTVEVSNPSCVDTGCKWTLGNVEAKPESTINGTLCVFLEHGAGLPSFESAVLVVPGEPGAGEEHGPVGAYLAINRKSSLGVPKVVRGIGTWAVRGN